MKNKMSENLYSIFRGSLEIKSNMLNKNRFNGWMNIGKYTEKWLDFCLTLTFIKIQ